MLVKSLLTYCKHHREDVETLFKLLHVFMNRHVASCHFLALYLEKDVAKEYSNDEKRNVFFKFVEVFSSNDYPQDLKAKVHLHQFVFVLLNVTLCYFLLCNVTDFAVHLNSNVHCHVRRRQW